MAPRRFRLPYRSIAPAISPARFSGAVLLSLGCHVVVASAVVAAHRGADVPGMAIAPTIVLVDLAPASDVVDDDAIVLPAASGRGEAPALEALSRRVEALTDENADLSAGLAEERRRTAQLEAEYRQEISALETAASALGQEAAALAADNEALAARVESGERQVTALEEELARRQHAERAARAEMQRLHERLVAALREEIAEKDVALEAANRGLTVSILDRVLFPSGQATLTREGEPIIDRIGSVLNGLPDARVLVEGHTDDVPIGAALRSVYPSNWELSTARATEVVRRLIQHAHVDPARLRAAGRADTEPVAGNESEEGRRHNRRIEIILLPPPPASTESAS